MNYLSHETTFESLLNILNSNQMLSINELKKIYPKFKGSSEDQNSIFFTPIFNEKFIFEKKMRPTLYLDLEKVLDIYNQYYINSGNSFKPLDGTPDERGNCKCRNTYHNNLDYSIFNGLENSNMNLCYKNKHEIFKYFFDFQNAESTTMRDVLDECDGGPEIAIVTPNISLNGVIKYVTLPNRNYVINNKYIKFQDVIIEGNDRTEKINNYFEHCRNITENLGGIFIEFPMNEFQRAGKKSKTRKIKTRKSKTRKSKTRKSKTRKIKTRKSKTRKSKTRKIKTRKIKTRKIKTRKSKTRKNFY